MGWGLEEQLSLLSLCSREYLGHEFTFQNQLILEIDTIEECLSPGSQRPETLSDLAASYGVAATEDDDRIGSVPAAKGSGSATLITCGPDWCQGLPWWPVEVRVPGVSELPDGPEVGARDLTRSI